MNGIDTILRKLNADADAEADAILEKARQEAAEITARYQAQADKEAADLAARNEKAGQEQEDRLVRAAQMEARKTVLAAKQSAVEKTYDRALDKLLHLSHDQYVEVLAELLVQAAPQGRGEVIFAAEDRARVGQEAVNLANQRLAQATAPELPKELTDTKVGSVIGKAVAGVSALAKGTALLVLSQDTAPIRGGFILRDGKVEVNCAFDTLVRLQKAETAGQVARQLFG